MRYTGLVLLLLCSSCAFLREPTVPMPAVFHAAPDGRGEGLIVLLPGLGDSPEDYEANGIVTAIQQANPGFDVTAADAHFGYYRSRTFLERLQLDILDPVAGRYRQVWLMGISLGGFGSMIYASEHPGAITGLILLAPYMGKREVIESVKAAGGLAQWVPPDFEGIEDEETRKSYETWRWLRGYAMHPANMPKLYLGYGSDDNLQVQNGLLADVLSPDRVATAPGGHKWAVWRPLIGELTRRALAP